ncbi:MAG: hypothetical protein ACI9F9_000949, partial [Candidatus Paceibacteria bacterium]
MSAVEQRFAHGGVLRAAGYNRQDLPQFACNSPAFALLEPAIQVSTKFAA